MVAFGTLGAGIIAAIVGAGLIAAAPQYAREMEHYAMGLGSLRSIVVPPFVPKALTYGYLLWLARIGGAVIALVGVVLCIGAVHTAMR